MKYIEIHTRNVDTATVDGRLVQRGMYASIYDAAIATVVIRAQDAGTPQLVKAIDDPGGGHVFWISVTPAGSVDPAEPPIADTPAPSSNGGGRRRRHRDTEVDASEYFTAPPADDDGDQYLEPTGDAMASPGTAPDSGQPAYAPPIQSSPPPPAPAYVDYSPPASLPEYVSEPQASFSAATPGPPSDAMASPEPVEATFSAPAENAPPSTTPQSDGPATGPIVVPQPPAAAVPAQPLGLPQHQPRPPQAQHRPQQPPTANGPWNAHPHQQQPPMGQLSQQRQSPGGTAPQTQQPPSAPPSLTDLRASRPDAPEPPASTGWRGGLSRLTGGLVKLAPDQTEIRNRRARDAVQRSLRGPRTVVIINTKGGGGKTTAVYSLAATFGQARGGYVLGWDNNETRGTLAWRSTPARHSNTAVDLLRDLERFEDPRNARVGDLDNYVRAQGAAQFDVLASDENAASAASIDGDAFRALHRSLSRFYRILVIDTGNNVKAPNWQAAVDLADQLVVVSSVREDTAGGASWTLDHLMEIGHADKVRNAVTILSAPKAATDPDQKQMQHRFREHFAARTRVVIDVPFDPALVDGDSIVFDALSPATREAWLHVAAAIAEGL